LRSFAARFLRVLAAYILFTKLLRRFGISIPARCIFLEMKTRKSIQIATVAFAVTMLAGYVSFSQRQARAQPSNVVAPGSKVQARLIQLPGSDQGQATNAPDGNERTKLSKPSALSSLYPARGEGSPKGVCDNRTEKRKASATNSSSLILAPGSKSIVPLHELQTSPTLAQTNAPRPALSPKFFPGSKSGRVFDPKEMQSLLTLTNARSKNTTAE
jgi:hypothetical protein